MNGKRKVVFLSLKFLAQKNDSSVGLLLLSVLVFFCFALVCFDLFLLDFEYLFDDFAKDVFDEFVVFIIWC